MADTNLSKDIIYIDVDDEITTVIDKLQQSDSKIVALVLPKRAAAFQSVVNMRLLKRSAANAKKNIVLITSEPSLLPLAGIAGLHVAKSAQSKPIVPDVPNAIDSSEIIDESVTDATQLAAGPSDNDTIEVDNDSLENSATVTTKQSFNKKLKVPNFDSFRAKVLIGGVLLLVLIVAGVFATMILPKATITIKTNTTDLASTLLVTTSPAIKEVNSSNKSVPGIAKELKKTDSQKAATTGQKRYGHKSDR